MPSLDRRLRLELQRRVRQARRVLEGLDRDLASGCWHEMLVTRFFEKNGVPGGWESEVTSGAMPPEIRRDLDAILSGLPGEVFQAEDSLGWAYQCWQSEIKAAANRHGGKIGADALPAMTQLFTDDYMVLFLLHNTLGAWWAARVLAANPRIALESPDEDTVRSACAVQGVAWDYLRFIRDGGTGGWRPAAGTFDGWPRAAKDITILDPCMGSGHFLVLALPMLAALRSAEEETSLAAAVEGVLRDNLFGLELDERCTRIAMANFSLAAGRLMGGNACLPTLHLGCTGRGMESYHEKSAWVGSLMQAVEDKVSAPNATQSILQGAYTLVATNVPYLARRKQDEVLQRFCEEAYPDAKGDLATCFVERCGAFCHAGGSMALVTPQNWLFLRSYARLRSKLLRTLTWNALVWVGEKGFNSPGAAGAFSALIIASRINAPTAHEWAGLDIRTAEQPEDKALALRSKAFVGFSQSAQAQDPDARFCLAESGGVRLSDWAVSHAGVQTGDAPRFLINFWEIPFVRFPWIFHQVNPDTTSAYGGLSALMRWEDGGGAMARSENARIQGTPAFGRQGVLVCHMRGLKCARYLGFGYDNNSAAILPKDPAHLSALWAFLSSPQYNEAVRAIDQKLNVTPATLVKVPFDLEYWQRVAKEIYPDGIPEPYSNDPSQWIFNGHPRGATHPLQVAVARLAGYCWPRQTGAAFSNGPDVELDGLEGFADTEGILCLHETEKQASAAQRLERVLAAAYGEEWSAALRATLLAGAGYPGRTLHEWLRDGSFSEHCALFRQRPFLWHIWDGHPDGFHVIVNYHRLAAGNGAGRGLLEKLVYGYLDDWIAGCSHRGKDVGSLLYHRASRLRKRLLAIMEGEPPHDIFVRWKALGEQPAGWSPDLDDGVRVNIRPFATGDSGVNRKREVGILRVVPKIRWDKDRGREPEVSKEDFPWYWGWDETTDDFVGGEHFTGERWNGPHYSMGLKIRRDEK